MSGTFKSLFLACFIVIIIVTIIRSIIAAIRTGEWRSWLTWIIKADQPVMFWVVVTFYTFLLIPMTLLLAVAIDTFVRPPGP